MATSSAARSWKRPKSASYGVQTAANVSRSGLNTVNAGCTTGHVAGSPASVSAMRNSRYRLTTVAIAQICATYVLRDERRSASANAVTLSSTVIAYVHGTAWR